MCEPELGVPPEFDGGAGVTIPVTVNGIEATQPLPNYACDAQSLQDGECFPGSTIDRLSGRTREGHERPEVLWGVDLILSGKRSWRCPSFEAASRSNRPSRVAHYDVRRA